MWLGDKALELGEIFEEDHRVKNKRTSLGEWGRVTLELKALKGIEKRSQ